MRSLHLSLLFLTCAGFLAAQSRPVLAGRGIDESRRHSLAGNTRPEAAARNDGGAVADSFPMLSIPASLSVMFGLSLAPPMNRPSKNTSTAFTIRLRRTTIAG